MSNSNSNISTSFETVFKKHKTIILALPIVLLALILGLYFTSSSKENTTVNNSNNADTSIPNSETKELSNSKNEVATEYEIMQDEKYKKSNEQESVELNDPNLSTTYEQPNDEVVNKVNKMIVEMDRKSKKKETVSNNNYSPTNSERSYKNVPVENSYNETPPNKNNTNDNLNSFFSSGSGKNSASIQSSDTQIYAVIKGDQVIKNRDRVTLMLTKNSTIKDKTFPKNTVFFATATFQNDRVNLVIVNISQIQVDLKAYDAEDGGIGLHVSQSLLAESTGEAVNDASDEVDVSGIPLGGTIKRILKRKQQIPKITLLNNQKIILKNT